MKRIHLVLVMVILAALAAANPGPAGAQDGNDLDRELGQAPPVIAEGVATITTDDVAWRLVCDVAQMPGDAEELERALGFVLATATGGAIERRESLGEDPAPYDRFAVVPPADADYTAGGELVHAGESFAAPEEPRALQLLGGTLQPDQSVGIPNTGFPSLLLATAGTLLVDFATGGDPVPLHAGEAVAIGDAASGGDGNTETTPTDPSDTVQVEVVAWACPRVDVDLSACDPLEDVTIDVSVDGSELEGSPFTTPPWETSFVGPYVQLHLPADATLTLTELDGLPDGYGPAPGHDPLTVEVADLDERGCGGEDICRYVDLINVPAAGSAASDDTGA